jgi:hypothetical protein
VIEAQYKHDLSQIICKQTNNEDEYNIMLIGIFTILNDNKDTRHIFNLLRNKITTEGYNDETDIIHNFKFYDFTEYEEKLFYYNNIDRNFICHENDNSDKKINFCKCNDCSIENNVLVEYNTCVSNKYNVLYYIKKLDTITERPLKIKHKNNIFEILTDEDIITRLGRFKKEKDINFGKMIGNKGIKGGSEGIYSENKLLLNFFAMLD